MPSPVRVFCAAARRPVSYDPGVLPSLGDALILDVTRFPHRMELATATLREAPWCAVLLVARQPLLITEVSRLLPLLPRHVAPLLDGQEDDATLVPQAIRQRPKPTHQDALDYLRLRQLDRNLIAAVEDALALAANTDTDTDTETDTDTANVPPVRARSTINRELLKHGPLSCRAWRALALLLPVLESAEASVEHLAAAHGLDSRTLQHQVRAHLGVELDVALTHPGWEWKLEAALRRCGLVQWARPSRRSSAGHSAPVMAVA